MVPYYRTCLLLICFCTAFSCQNNKAARQTNTVTTDAAALAKKYHLDKIILPPGFEISVYAEVPDARSMTLSPAGILYVGNRAEKNVYAVTDENKDGKADKVYKIATGLNTPNGVAFKDGNLYIATISEILRLDNIEADLQNPPKPVTVYDKFPTDKHHGWKFIAFGPDGKLYVPVGAPCNICEETNPMYASITSLDVHAPAPTVFAHGIRNSVGFAWHPETKKLWFTENGRDELGDDVPGDELNNAPDSGLHFGYPYCHQGNISDPKFGKGKNCADYEAPVQVLGPHVAALGMRFYTGKMFGAAYKNQVFIAEHGSWNRSKAIGYRISTVQLDAQDRSLGYSVFAEGWLQPDGAVSGRPVDVEVMPDGALLVSDDYAGVIYRISKK